MGMMEWEPGTSKIVGMCGTLLIDMVVDSFCTFDPASKTLAHLQTFDHIAPTNSTWKVEYDPDTGALDPVEHLYFARLYTRGPGAGTRQGPWMPDHLVTLSSTNGSILHTVYGGGPEYSGTRFDTKRRRLWSGSNAPGGIDLCLVNMTTGSTVGTGAWVQPPKQNHMFMAATAVIDAVGGWYFLTASHISDGFVFTATSIANANISHDRIDYVYTHQGLHGALVANLHAWSTL